MEKQQGGDKEMVENMKHGGGMRKYSQQLGKINKKKTNKLTSSTVHAAANDRAFEDWSESL